MEAPFRTPKFEPPRPHVRRPPQERGRRPAAGSPAMDGSKNRTVAVQVPRR